LEERVSELQVEINKLTHRWHDSIHSNGIARCDKGQAARLMRQSQHLQGNTSPLECKNQFGGRHNKV